MDQLKDSPILAILCLLHLIIGLVLGNFVPVRLSEEKKPVVIYYQVDSYGGAWHGKVTKKEVTETGYAVEVGTYGRFLVTKEQYDTIKVGDVIPDDLRERGIGGNVPGGSQ